MCGSTPAPQISRKFQFYHVQFSRFVPLKSTAPVTCSTPAPRHRSYQGKGSIVRPGNFSFKGCEMAEPVGAASPSSAAANTRQSTPPKRCDRRVGAGNCAPSGATPPPASDNAYRPMHPKVAQKRAQPLIDTLSRQVEAIALFCSRRSTRFFKKNGGRSGKQFERTLTLNALWMEQRKL